MLTSNVIEQLAELLVMDKLTYTMIEEFCLTTYRMGNNPLPATRKWLECNNINLPIHYIESDKVALHTDDILLRVCGRVVPLMIVEAIKHYGLTEKVNIFVISSNIKIYGSKWLDNKRRVYEV